MIYKKVVWMLTFVLVFSLLSVVVFARPPVETCCGSVNDCIYGGVCVSSGSTSWDVDGDGDNDYCLNREWWDCNTDSQCPSNQWCTGSGGSPRYDCKDDLNKCAVCSRNAQCQSGLCYQGNCRPIVSYSCTTDTSCCSAVTDLYCSKLNPTTRASVGPRCCDSSPLQWWNPAIIGADKCTGVDECTPCSPFHPSCSPTSIFGCCSFLGIYTERVITTY